MQKILVTGSNGFLASRILACHPDWTGLSHAQFEMTDIAQMKRTVKQYRPQAIIHCAALSDTGYCQQRPEESRRVNWEGPAALSRICKQTDCKLIFMSSDQVYNGCSGLEAFAEDIPLDPRNSYGIHKLAAERAIQELLPDAVILRLTWMFDLPLRGKRCNSNLLWNLVRALITRIPLRVPIRDYRGITDVWEVAHAMEQILSLPGGVYNCGSENEWSTYETASIALDAMRIPLALQSEILLREAGHPRNLKIQNRKIAEQGVHFSTTQEAIRRCVEAYGFQF